MGIVETPKGSTEGAWPPDKGRRLCRAKGIGWLRRTNWVKLGNFMGIVENPKESTEGAWPPDKGRRLCRAKGIGWLAEAY